MQVTRASEYAMLGLLALARRPVGEVALLDVVAHEEDVPVSFLGKIFQSLARAGLVKSTRGSGGGFVLLRNAPVAARFLAGPWTENGMPGYTSRGTGATGVAARLFCPPEITLHTLRLSRDGPAHRQIA